MMGATGGLSACALTGAQVKAIAKAPDRSGGGTRAIQ